MDLAGGRWKYINEGNVHIVLHLLETEHVLRLIKLDKKSVTRHDVHNSAMFVNLVMIPILFNKCDIYQEVIELSNRSLTELRNALDVYRPENRKFKSELSSFATKTLNLTLLSPKCDINYCVEIKPKEGFISSNIQPLLKCYYCLKQYLKLKTHQIKNISNYCPLDLFSGDRKRMKQALHNLIDNPQNNFKIFKDGKIIYHDNSNHNHFVNVVESMEIFKRTNMFIDFLINILLSKPYTTIEDTEDDNKTEQNSKCGQSTSLENDVFLDKLLQAQMLSQKVDLNNTKGVGGNTEYVSDILELLQKNQLNLHSPDDRKKFIKCADPIHLAMISAVAKDCSIMICFSPNYIKEHPFISIENKKIPYRAFLTDLEPKSVESLMRRDKTERDATNSYKSMEMCGEYCKIQPHTETRAKQLEAWQQLITEYFKTNKLSTLDIREAQSSPLFNNAAINRKLSQEGVVTILEDMAKTGRAAPIDKSKTVWEVYWHSLDEWGNMIYSWASNNGMNNSVCTLFELREGDTTVDEEFHGLDMNILTKALRSLEAKGKCELMEFDDNQGVKFF